MTTFAEIKIGDNFYLFGCMGRSRWIKISKLRGSCVDTYNGRYEYNQEKPFLPNQKVTEL